MVDRIANFNSQPHEEADDMVLILENAHLYFNSQPHEEADGAMPNATDATVIFQLTASRGG